MPSSKLGEWSTMAPTPTLHKQMTTQINTRPGFDRHRVINHQICVVRRYLYTYALVVGVTDTGYQRRYCYEEESEAVAALSSWDGADHPPGPWIKCKGADVDLLNPKLE